MKLGIIGTGRMAQAIVGGILKSEALSAESISGTDPDSKSKEAFLALDEESRLGWEDSIEAILSDRQVILIAVKPQNIEEVLEKLKSAPADTCFISIAAGVKLEMLSKALGSDRPLIRVMPNTPLLVGKGVVAWCGNDRLTPGHEDLMESIFSPVADVHRVGEEEMDAVTALSGSGPAFFYRIIEAFEKAAIAEGLSPERARPFATGTAIGACSMLQQTGLEPDELVAQVRSKGGTTAAGLEKLENSELEEIIQKTIAAAAERSRELGGR
jgi:pyrroline-5-carboxylate reductase